MRLYILLPLALFLLTACNDSDDVHPNGPPVIHDIKTDITHWHTHYVSSMDDLEARISFTVSLLITDPGGLQDLAEVYIENPADSRSWYLVGGPENVRWYRNYDVVRGVLEYRSFDPDNLDAITLNGWELVVQDHQGNEVRQPFDFMLPDGQPADDGVRVYSAEFATPDLDDVPALEAMSIADNALSVSSDPGTSSFNISFQSTDTRASNYLIDFYSALPDRRHIGYANKFISPSIESTPINTTAATNLSLPWEEIYFAHGIDAEDVASARITLMNEDVELDYLEGVFWMSYAGISELIDMTPIAEE